MKFGGLSEKEVEEISKVLENESIRFTVLTDEIIQNYNDKSMKNNIRHLSPASISTNILAIEVDDNDFNNMTNTAVENLNKFGITNIVPTEIEFTDSEPEPIQNVVINGQTKVMGTYLFLIIIVSVLAMALSYMLRAR